MKEYSNKDIQEITKLGVLFKDGIGFSSYDMT